jgi:hypothetical protein
MSHSYEILHPLGSIHSATDRLDMVSLSSSATVVGNGVPVSALKTAQPRKVWNRPYGGDSSRLSRKREYVVRLDFARVFQTSAMPDAYY